MFNREQASYHDTQIIPEDQYKRFKEDRYLAKYLYSCFNPEFKVFRKYPKQQPSYTTVSAHIEVGEKIKINEMEDVF